MSLSAKPRRLFVGDLHGCREELDDLLHHFGFRAGVDALYPVGDAVGKGPDVPGTLRRLKTLDARPVIGNHDQHLLDGAALPPEERRNRQKEYLESLGTEREQWL